MLPEGFLKRAEALLGEEYADFIGSLEGEAVRGLRANLIKTNTATVSRLFGDALTPIPYRLNGFIIDGEVRIGRTPEHHSGMIYVQDPGAMAALCATEIKPDFKVLDVCAAPGGKSSQAAELLGKGGFLLSNEYVPKRAKIVVGNFERLGVRNAVVTSLDSSELGEMFDGYFDLVIVDAPCSGEGMFRKSEEALNEWSEENVLACAERQKEILENVAGTVRAGGRLLYSTCTYSIEENEGVVSHFLKGHPEYRLIKVRDELSAATRNGIRAEGIDCEGIELCRRFYPHVSRGEGQFVALLERENDGKKQTILYKDGTKPLNKRERELAEGLLGDLLVEMPEGRLAKYGENIVLISHGVPIPPKSVFMSGVLVGELSGNMIKPSHQLFSAYGHLFKRRVELSRGDKRADEYLSGLEISAEVENGFCAVLFEGAALGGGKASGGRVKNHYPKGLRNKG